MRIAILGTRGIPNNYGGFEQLAQYLSLGLKAKGHEIFVYCSSNHPFLNKTWNGIQLLHKYDPEKKIGTAGQFIYDLNCILDCRKRKFDVILNLGYTSSSVWMWLLPSGSKVITNMDGLEWKRSKYSNKVQRFLKYAEKLAVKRSDLLVADSRAIQSYLAEKYQVSPTFIAYGAPVFENQDTSVLNKFGVNSGEYNLLIARMEPENNLEMILDGVSEAKDKHLFFVVGNVANQFGQYLVDKFKGQDHIKFTGPIYDEKVINNLRFYCHLYFHGHSVGGTNPSLLEAMGCSCLIAANDNQFNRSVLGADALYFKDASDVSKILDDSALADRSRKSFLAANLKKIREEYSWDHIVFLYEKLMAQK